MMAVTSLFKRIHIKDNPYWSKGCKLVDKALELQENMSWNSGKLYSKSPPSEKTASAPNRSQGNHFSRRDAAPSQPHSWHDEPTVSSNAGARGNLPRLACNNARHTITNNQAQARSNHSAPDLRLHINDRRVETTRNNDDDDVGPQMLWTRHSW